MDWLEIVIETTPGGIDALQDKLFSMGIDGFAVEDGAEFDTFLTRSSPHWDMVDDALIDHMRGAARVKIYIPQDAAARETKYLLREGLAELRAARPDIDFGRLSLGHSLLREEDWANAWKQYYKPLEIGRRLLVCPDWETPPPGNDRVIYRNNPGMVFGTGDHASTRLCLLFLEELVRGGEMALDIGCGTGILAVTALLLGARHATMIDIDPAAEGVAAANAARNGVEAGRYTTLTGDIHDPVMYDWIAVQKYDIITANIVADVIIALAPKIPSLLTPGGVFIASGIIEPREDDVLTALEAAGLTATQIGRDAGWIAVCGGADRART